MKKGGFSAGMASVVLGVMLVSACGRKAVEQEYPVSIELEKGVKTVVNPDFPRDGRTTPVPVEELSIEEKEGTEGYTFNRPQWIRADDEGRIYVMDWGDVCIKVFDALGRWVQTIGRKGQGPGEFDVPAYFDLMPDGRIAVMDSRNQRVTFFDPDGQFGGSFRVKGFHSQMRCDSLGRVYFERQTPEEEIEKVGENFRAVPYTTIIIRADAEGQTFEEIGRFEGVVRVLRRTPEGGTIALSPPYVILWAVAPGDRVVVGFNVRFDLTVYGPDLQPELRFLREYEPPKNPYYDGDPWDHEFFHAYEKTFILVDDDGNIWLDRAIPPVRKKSKEDASRTEWVRSPEHIYDVFSPDGIYIREVTLPFRIQWIKRGKFYVLERDEEGFARIKRFSLRE